ncbi:hypothetical protein, partial [Allofournierella sp.]|uniref:hypothetical protein n=1 Tax=Allofournierella sp. TaxID=1940256 RepID=UPI003AB13D90
SFQGFRNKTGRRSANICSGARFRRISAAAGRAAPGKAALFSPFTGGLVHSVCFFHIFLLL